MRKKDLSGLRFGKLLVEKQVDNPKRNAKRCGLFWQCNCDCGNTTVLSSGALNFGNTRSCGCLRRKDISGQKFGRLRVISFSHIGQCRNSYWNCQCDCGKYVKARSANLINGDKRSCGCLQLEVSKIEKGMASFNVLLGNYKESAKARKMPFDFSSDEFRDITSKCCYYCGCPPIQAGKQRFTNGYYVHNGIDRIDNEVGYTKENCVPCCKMCNYAKRDVTKEEFEEWILRAAAIIGSRRSL